MTGPVTIASSWPRVPSKGSRMKTRTWIPGIVAIVACVVVPPSPGGDMSCESVSPEVFTSSGNGISSGWDDDLGGFAESPSDARCCDTGPEPTWQFAASALFLDRRDPASAALVTGAIDGAEILNARDLDLGVHAGFDMSLTRWIGECYGFEARYFGVDQWSATTAASTTPGSLLQWNAAPPVFVWAGTGIEATATSELHNIEVNGRYRWRERWTLLAGFRYVELDERLTADLIGADVPFSYQATTRNRLYGGQLGAILVLWDCGGPFTAEATGKAGIFGNAAAQHSSYATDIAALTAGGNQTAVPFLGEIGITGRYSLSPRWSATFGYQLLWITQVALATEQIAASDFVFGNGIDATGDTFYHGATVGMQYVR